MSLQMTSTEFANGGPIPSTFTCEGKDESPPLSWVGVPSRAKSLVLIVDDPDAPDPAAPQRTWVHWVVYNIAPETAGFPRAMPSLPAGAAAGLNDWSKAEYGGPCPPIGRHRYFFKLYALDARLELSNPSKADVVQAMSGHILAKAVLVGTYEKKRQ